MSGVSSAVEGSSPGKYGKTKSGFLTRGFVAPVAFIDGEQIKGGGDTQQRLTGRESNLRSLQFSEEMM